MKVLQELVLEMLSIEESIYAKVNETKELRKQAKAVKDKIRVQAKQIIFS